MKLIGVMHTKIQLFSTLYSNAVNYVVNKSRLHSKLEKASQQQCQPFSAADCKASKQ